jgi:hypothetical protein
MEDEELKVYHELDTLHSDAKRSGRSEGEGLLGEQF